MTQAKPVYHKVQHYISYFQDKHWRGQQRTMSDNAGRKNTRSLRHCCLRPNNHSLRGRVGSSGTATLPLWRRSWLTGYPGFSGEREILQNYTIWQGLTGIVFLSQDTKWLLLSWHDHLLILGEHVHMEVESTGVVAGSLRVGELDKN